MSKPRTLGECRFIDRMPRCAHCDHILAKASAIQVFADSVVAHCKRCGCMTPFKRIDYDAALPVAAGRTA